LMRSQFPLGSANDLRWLTMPSSFENDDR